jgi:hypothetical protein
MLSSPPQLTQDARDVLRVILDNKILRGGEIMRHAGIKTAAELVAPVRELVDLQLVEVIGGLTAETIPFTTFGTRPSAQEYLRSLLRVR